MKKNKIVLLSLFTAAGISLTIGSTLAAWAVTDNAGRVSIKVSVGEVAKHTVNYYTVNVNGTAFTKIGTEEVYDGDTVSSVPTITNTIDNYKFEDWYTSDALTTKFNQSTPITADTDVYAGFIGYFAKSNSGSSYTKLSIDSGSLTQYVSQQSETWDYTYSLAETSFTGHTLNIYSHLLRGTGYTSVASTQFLNGNTSTSFTSKYRIYFNDTNNEISLTKRFYIEMQNTEDYPHFHLWGSENNYETAWRGIGTTYLKIVDNWKRYYYADIDTSKYDNYILNTTWGSDNPAEQTGNLKFAANSNNCYWCNNKLEGGWFEFSE